MKKTKINRIGHLRPDERGPAQCPVCGRTVEDGTVAVPEHEDYRDFEPCKGVGKSPRYGFIR